VRHLDAKRAIAALVSGDDYRCMNSSCGRASRYTELLVATSRPPVTLERCIRSLV
jgi:hypothetical protein